MARQWILLTALVCLTLHGSLTGGQGGYSYLDGPSFKVDLAPGPYDGVYDREDGMQHQLSFSELSKICQMIIFHLYILLLLFFVLLVQPCYLGFKTANLFSWS